MLFNGKTHTEYKGFTINNVIAFEDEGDGMLTVRLAKFCDNPRYRFINRLAVKVNPAMARAMANRLTDWADLREANKSQAA